MTHLGCHNNRGQQLKKLAKSTAARLVQHYAQEQIIQNANANAAAAGGTQPQNNAAGSGQAANTNQPVQSQATTISQKIAAPAK